MKPVTDQIRAEIAAHGAITFARFMDLALYCPQSGYYERKEDTPGRRGDFYTSVSVGPLFGELLAFQFAEWLDELPIADCGLQIVEAGAHDGRLARDILNWLRLRRPALFERLKYWLVEPSARRQEWQSETLTEFSPRVQWITDFCTGAEVASVAPRNRQSAIGNRQSPGIYGLIFSNEFLDALPVHRLGWDAQRHEWFEWGVTMKGDEFIWTRLHSSSAIGNRQSAIGNLPRELLDVLPDGFTTEVCPAAEAWWREAAGVLKRGKLLTLDYGLTAEECFLPQRAGGTLRAYHRHRLSTNVLANPGEQDLTAHVNFTALQQAGEAAGLRTKAHITQAKFLTGIIARAGSACQKDLGLSPERTRQFQTLVHPNHLGSPFRVLVQTCPTD